MMAKSPDPFHYVNPGFPITVAHGTGVPRPVTQASQIAHKVLKPKNKHNILPPSQPFVLRGIRNQKGKHMFRLFLDHLRKSSNLKSQAELSSNITDLTTIQLPPPNKNKHPRSPCTSTGPSEMPNDRCIFHQDKHWHIGSHPRNHHLDGRWRWMERCAVFEP